MGFPEFRVILIRARRVRGWTLSRLAAELEMTPASVSMWESGARIPAAQNARRWADALDVDFPDDTEGWFNKATNVPVALCGTRSGYYRHRSDGQEACHRCKVAAAAWHREYLDRMRQAGVTRLSDLSERNP